MDIPYLPSLAIFTLALIVAYATSYILAKMWIPAAKYFKLVGKDMNKYGHPEVPEAGGVAVIFGLAFGLFTYLFLKALDGSSQHLTAIYALISTVLLAGFLGFADDILGWKKGIAQKKKALFSTALALPLMTFTLLHSQYNSFSSWGIPLWVYALIIVPIGIVGASNAINMVAGYNGLEAGLGIITLVTLSIKAYMDSNFWIMFMALIGVAALLGFLAFNWYPAKLFPGDSLTYPLGAYIGALVILGNMEIFGALLFPIYYLKLYLYIKAKKIDKIGDIDEFGIPNENNHIEMPSQKIYGVAHIVILLQKKLRGYATERGVVTTLYIFHSLICGIVLSLYLLMY